MWHRFIANGLIYWSLLTLIACTPSHTQQKTELYARKVGITNQYEISRWHNRRIPADSRLLIAVSNPGELGAAQVSAAVARPLSAFFARADMLPGALPVAAARREAVKGRYDFLLDVAVTEISRPPASADDGSDPAEENVEADTPPATAQDTETTNLYRAVVEVALVDVVSGHTVDKFLINTRASYLNPVGTRIDNLLSGPLTDLGKDLVGL